LVVQQIKILKNHWYTLYRTAGIHRTELLVYTVQNCWYTPYRTAGIHHTELQYLLSFIISTFFILYLGFYKESGNTDSQQKNFLTPDKVTFIIWSLDFNTLRQAIQQLDSNLSKESHHKKFEDSTIIKKMQDYQVSIESPLAFLVSML